MITRRWLFGYILLALAALAGGTWWLIVAKLASVAESGSQRFDYSPVNESNSHQIRLSPPWEWRDGRFSAMTLAQVESVLGPHDPTFSQVHEDEPHESSSGVHYWPGRTHHIVVMFYAGWALEKWYVPGALPWMEKNAGHK
jgi:hypothetical protein